MMLGGAVALGSALDSSERPGFELSGRGNCVVFLGETLYSTDASLHPGV